VEVSAKNQKTLAKKKFPSRTSNLHPPPANTTMPTATVTKAAMSGTKRKGAPVKSEYVKESKKAKFEDGKKVVKKSKIVVPLPTKKIVKKVEVESEEISEDSDSDGGVPVGDSNDEEEDEDLPKAEDGLHPERAKAVVVNSKSPLILN